MINKTVLFVVDDEFPKIAELVDQSVYDEKIEKDVIQRMVNEGEWGGLHSLRELLRDILSSSDSIAGDIQIFGFSHPAQCLDAIHEGLLPDVIIYDWEYGVETGIRSSDWLKEILENSRAFVFVYSKVRDDIPMFLDKSDFDDDAERFQLFSKVPDADSVFSSEEFIFQYLKSRVSSNGLIKISGIDVFFSRNGYLEKPSDIMFLEEIVGRKNLINKLETLKGNLSAERVEEIVSDVKAEIFHSAQKKCLVMASHFSKKKINDLLPMTALETMKKYGLKKLKEVLDIGFAGVND